MCTDLEKEQRIFNFRDTSSTEKRKSQSSSYSTLGPPGIGKTSSIARFALKWVEGAKELRRFDFVFAIQLKYAHKASSLAELIKLQHDRLKVSECSQLLPPANKVAGR